MSAVMTEGWRTLIAETPPATAEELEERQKRHEKMLAEAAAAGAARYQEELDTMVEALKASKMGLAPLPREMGKWERAAVGTIATFLGSLAVSTALVIAGPTIVRMAKKAYRIWKAWRPPTVNIDINPDLTEVTWFARAILGVVGQIVDFASIHPHILVGILGLAAIGGGLFATLLYLYKVDDRK